MAVVVLASGSIVVGLSPAANAVAPTVTTFSPSSGSVGKAVTITGTGFVSGQTTVQFNGVNAALFSVTSTSVVAAVPTYASTGPITVTVSGGGSVTTSTPFTVTTGVWLSNPAPSPGSSFSVSGSGFAPNTQITLTQHGNGQGTPEVGTTSSDANGNWVGTVTIPATTPTGSYTLVANELGGNLAASALMTVRANFPQPAFSGRHRGAQPFETQLTSGTIASADVDWAAPIPFTANNNYWAPRTVVSGGYVYFVASDNNLHQINAATGAQGFAPVSVGVADATPVVVNNNIYLATASHLIAVTAAGGIVYSVTCADCGAATLAPDSIAAGNGLIFIGDSGGVVRAYQASNGARVWTSDNSAGVQPSIGVSVQGTTLAEEMQDGSLLVFDATTGHQTSSHPAGSGGSDLAYWGGPTIVNNNVCWTQQNYQTRCTNGVTDQRPSGFINVTAPAIDGNLQFVGGYSSTGAALDAFDQTGALRWSTQLPNTAGQDEVAVPPVVANGVVYVLQSSLTTGSAVVALDEQSGIVRAAWNLNDSCISSSFTTASSPVIANGVLYATCASTLMAIDIAGGLK